MCASNCNISIYSFVDLCHKYLVNTYRVPGTVLGAGSLAFLTLLSAWALPFTPRASVPIYSWMTQSILRHRLCSELHADYLLDSNSDLMANTYLVPHVKT